MTIEEMYEVINGDFDDVQKRLRNPVLIEKFVRKFLNDPSYDNLLDALDEENYEDAFRAAHTLKGVCLNLSFVGMFEVSNEITEMLRPQTGEFEQEELDSLMNELEKQYNIVVEGINKLDN